MESSNKALKIILLVIFSPLLLIFWPVTIIVAIAVNLANQPHIDATEELVSVNLKGLDQDSYTVINNVMLPSKGNTSHSQIDHIVVSRYGIFCIETKSHRGWIFGSADRQYWTQVLYRDKYRIYNPLWQNYAHMEAIKSLLNMNLKAPIVPIVVFPNADKIRVDGTRGVGDIEHMLQRISNYKTKVYDPYEYERIISSISNANRIDSETVYQHRAEVKNLITSSIK